MDGKAGVDTKGQVGAESNGDVERVRDVFLFIFVPV
jgi:hypothetical protein